MEKIRKKIDGEVVSCLSYTNDEMAEIFKGENWERKFIDKEFLKSVGLSYPPETFLVAGSSLTEAENGGKIAGICALRYDEKDETKGYPINSNHWDFIQMEKEVIMVPGKNKLEEHWFESVDKWKEHVEEKPPHKEES